MKQKFSIFLMSFMLVMQIISNGLFIPMTASATDTAPVEQTELTDEEQAQVAAEEADKLDNAQQFIADLFTDETKSDIKSTVGQPQVTTAEACVETVAEKDQQLLTDTIVLVKAFIAVNALLNDDKTAIVKDFDEQQLATAKNAVALVDDSFTEGKQVLTERLALVEKSLVKAEVKEQAVAKEQQITKNETTSVEKVAVKAKAVNEKTEPKEITQDAGLDVEVTKNGNVLAENAEVQDGDSIGMNVKFNLTSIAIEKNGYGNGDYILIKLPVGMLADVKPASGIIKNGDEELGNYEISGEYLKITLIDIYDEQIGQPKAVEEGFVNLTATLKSGSDSDPDQSLVFGEKGKNNEEVTIPLTFTPKPAKDATLITKDGQVNPATGKLTWTVIVNGNLSAKAGENTFTDNLPEQLEYESISATEITYNLIGKASEGIVQSLPVPTDKKNFSYVLPDASKAYKFVLVTKNVSTSDAAEETISNTAKIEGTVAGEATKSVDVTYGTPLEKTVTGDGNGETTWNIKYNYNQKDRKDADATLTDAFDDIHELVENSFVIEKVDSTGKNAIIADPSTYTISKVTNKDGKNSFTIKFNDEAVNGQAYHIQYKTKLADKDGIVAKSGTLKNTVSFGEGKTKKEVNSTIDYSYNLGYKNGSIDYVNKKIDWTIVINPSDLKLNDVVVTDTYPIDRSLTAPTEFEIQVGNGESTTLDSSRITKNVLGEFILGLGNIEKKQTIKYSTPYDVDKIGKDPIVNNVSYTYKTPTKTESQSTSFDKSVNIDEKQSTKNGYKSGSYDYTNRVFNWEAGFNYKRQEIQSGVFEDTLGDNQELIADSVKLYKVTLSNDNVNGEDGNPIDMGNVGELKYKTDGTGFTFTFKDSASNIDAYKFKYQSKDKDEQMEAGEYTNNAKLTVGGNEKYNQNASVEVTNATHTVEKGKPSIDDKNQILTWSMIINKGQSKLSNATITDTPGSNQMILPETFKIYELATTNGTDFENNKKLVLNSKELTSIPDENGNYVYTENDFTVTQNIIGSGEAISNGFIVKFPETITKAYEIEYDAYYNDATGTNTTNTATLKYNNDEEASAGKDDKGQAKQYNIAYSDSNAGATRSKVDLKIHKIDPMDNNKALAGAVFELYNGKGKVKLATGTTDENGDVVFKGYYEGTYQLKEITAPDGFVTTGSTYEQQTQFKLLKDANTFVVPGGNSVITKTVANYKEGACVEKTITVKENGTAVNGAIITIKDKDGKVVTLKDADDTNPAQTTVKTDGNGQVKIPLQYAVADYTFTVEQNNVTKEYSFADLTGDCAVEVDLKTSACKETTITVENGNNVVENAEIQIIDNETKQAVALDGTNTTVTTDATGKVTVPGKYIDKEKYTIEVTVDDITKTITTYASEDCNVTINFATTACTTTTVTVKNGDNVVENAEIQIIDNETKQAVALDGTNTTVTTDDAGKVTVPGKYIDKEKYTIEVTVDGITKAIVDYSNTDLTTCEVEVNINTAACTNNVLTVKTGSVLVVDGTEVTVKFSDTKTEKYVVKNGKVTFPASEVVDGKVIVSIPNYEEQEITIEHCQGTVEFLSTACIETTVTINNNGIATEDAEIQIIDKDTEQVVEVNGQTTLTTDENGQVKIPGQYVDVNKYVIDVTVNGVTKEISSYAVSDCALTIDFKTTEAACVQTTVTVSNKGQVASGASVKVINKATGAVEEINGQTILTTDVNGQVIVPNEYGDNTKYYLQLTVEGVTRNVVAFTVENCEIVIDFAKACPDFTVSYQGPANSTAAFTLTGEGYSKEITVATDATGKAVYTLDATLKPGQYTLKQTSTPSGYRTAGDVAITVADDKCAAGITVTNTKVPVPPIVPPINPDKCENPTISVTPSTGDKPKAGTTAIVTVDGKTTVGKVDENGKVTFEGTPPTLEPGKKVTVKVDGYKETTTTISEKDCTTTITITPNDKCENPTISVITPNGDKPEKGTKVTVTVDGKTTTGTVDENGKVTFEGTPPTLEPGKKVTVKVDGYKETTSEMNEKDCDTTIVITPNDKCENPTISVAPLTGDKPEKGTKVTVTTEDGKTTTGTVNEDGTITFEPGKEPTLEPGKKVTVEVEGYEPTTTTVNDKECHTTVTITPKNACDKFEVTVEDSDGDTINTVRVTIDGTTVKTTNGTYTFDQAVAPGTKVTFEKNGYKTQTVIVGDDCQVTVTLVKKDDSEEPGTDPEDPDNGGDGEDPNDGNTPDEGPDSDDSDNNNNNNGNQNGNTDSDDNNSDNQNANNNNGNNTPGNGNNATNGTTGNKAPSTGSSLLPQTGEQVALYSLVGMLLIGAAFMLFKRNRRKA